MKKILAVSFILIDILLAFSQEAEKKHPILSDKFMFNASIYSSSQSIKIRVDGSDSNPVIDFNKAFGLNNNETSFSFNFNWRYGKNWSLSSEYFSLKKRNRWELERDINWGDVTFKTGSNVRAGVGLDMYRVFIGRTLSRGLKHEFGIGMGLHIPYIWAFIEGDAYINEEEFIFEKKSVSAIAPLPNLGLWYFYAPTPKWGFTANIDWFSLSYNNISSKVMNIGPGVHYQVFKHIGIGLAYRYFKFTTSIDREYWEGNFNMIFQGPLFSISGNF